VKFEGDRSKPLEVVISQTQEFGKAIRPLFADSVTLMEYAIMTVFCSFKALTLGIKKTTVLESS